MKRLESGSGAPAKSAATETVDRQSYHQSSYADDAAFSMSLAEAIASGDAAHGGAVAALLEQVETACSSRGGILDHDSPERQVLLGTLTDYVRVLGIRPQDSVPTLSFDCPACAGPAHVLDAVAWECRGCRRSGTRWTLAHHILNSPRLLSEYLLIVPTRSSNEQTGGAA